MFLVAKKNTTICVKKVFGYLFINHIAAASMSQMKAVDFTPGGVDNLRVADVLRPPVKANEVLIKVSATAINRADTLQRKGLYPSPPGESKILGLEAAGTVHEVGRDCRKWKRGDSVMALLSGGGNAEYVAAYEDHVMPVSGQMTFTEAAAIPEVWITAFQLLHFVGRLQPDDRVLIHAGGSGVGTAAVQLVRLANATAYVTAGSQEKIDFAKSLGAIDGFNYKEGNFSDKVLAATNGKGVNLILDCVGGSYWQQNMECIAMDGTWVLYGLLGGGKVDGPLLAQLLRKRAHLVASTLRSRSVEYKAELVAEFTRKALPHFSNGTLKTIVHKVLPGLESIADAHRLMELNSNTGKIVLQIDHTDKEEL